MTAEVKSGLRRVLSASFAYNFFQRLVGAEGARERLAAEELRIAVGARVLDLGCGTAEILRHLPVGIEYTGYDLSERYIRTAERRFGSRGRFIPREFTGADVGTAPKFDLVMAIGLLHHLEDGQVEALLSLARDSLRPEGRFVSLDPCLVPRQNPIARLLIRSDRGKHVRSEQQYVELASRRFSTVHHRVRHDLLRIPYTHIVMDCSQG